VKVSQEKVAGPQHENCYGTCMRLELEKVIQMKLRVDSNR